MDKINEPIVSRGEEKTTGNIRYSRDSFVNPLGDGVALEVSTVTMIDEFTHVEGNVFTNRSERCDISVLVLDKQPDTVVVGFQGFGKGKDTVGARLFLSEAQARKLVSLLHRELDRGEASDEG